MNYTIVDNPYKDENSVITTRGVMTDAKIAKLNNATKRPAIVKHWEESIPQVVVTMTPPVEKDYNQILTNLGLVAVNHAKEASNSGAKKLRVNKIVNEKANKIYNNVDKVDVTPEKIVELPKVEEKKVEVKSENPFEPSIVNSRSEIHGRHERTGEIPVDAIKEAVKNDTPLVTNNAVNMTSRTERNAMVNDLPKVEVKTESKAGDMDLYNNLLHNAAEDDVSRQLQGARNQLNIEKEESRKLAEQYGAAVKELERLKEDINNKKKAQEQQAKEELSMTSKSI